MSETATQPKTVAPMQQRRTIGIAIAIASCATIALATLTPTVPSRELRHFCLVCGVMGGVDVILNVLLFAPLGFGLALARVRGARAIAAMCAFTCLVEFLQAVAITGRDASLSDLITNSTGGALGFLIGRHIRALARPGLHAAPRLFVGWLAMWIVVQAVAAYSLIARVPAPPYYGQIVIFPRETVVFPGRVLSVTVDSVPVTDGPLGTGTQLRTLLERRDGALVLVGGIPGAIPRKKASIFRIGGRNDRDIASMEQDGRDLLFGVSTGADALRLRPYAFRLRDVFEDGSGARAPDTVQLGARYGRSRTTLSASAGGRHRGMDFVPRQSQGWRLVMPFQTYAANDLIETLASAVFVFVLIAPAGYWGHFSRGAHSTTRVRRGPASAVVQCAVVVAIGFVGIPLAIGLPAAGLRDWISAACGVGCGALIGHGVARRQVAGGESVGRW